MKKLRTISTQNTLLFYFVALGVVFFADGVVDDWFFNHTSRILDSILPNRVHEVFMRLLVALMSATVVFVVIRFSPRERRTARYEAHLYHIAPVGIFQTDPKGQLTYVNRKWSALFGQPIADSLGSGWLTQVYPEDRTQVSTNWEKAITCKKPFSLKFRLTQPSGTPCWVRCEAEPHYDGEKQVGYLGFLSDIQELKTKELALQSITDKLETALAVKTEFLQVMEHEFRTPLNGIYGSVQVLQGMSPTQDQAELFNILGKSALGLSKIFSDIVAYQRLKDNRINPELESVHPRQILDDLAEVYRPLAQQKQIQFVVDCDPELAPVYSDSVLLSLVLTHLLSNALKFTHTGKVLVSISSRKKDQQQFARFLVKDTGIGMDAELTKQATLPFFQLDQTASRSFQGLGLGLTLVEKTLHLLGSKLEVEGTVGKGTTCSFDLPLFTLLT